MPLRMIIFSLALIGFLSASTGGGLYYYAYREAAFEKHETQARSQLSLMAGQLSGYLSEHLKSVRTLAEIRELRRALEETNLDTIYQANQVLDTFAASLEARVCYLINAQGITLCSSNRNRADSFVGMDYGFRPYFKQARTGHTATYLALGVNSLKRGIYYSHPVYSTDRKEIIGVAVIKASVEFVEDSLFSSWETPLFFTAPNGLIFISNVPDLRFQLLWERDEAARDALLESRQFGNGPWNWSGFSRDRAGKIRDREGNRFLGQALAVQGHPGWALVSLRNARDMEEQVSRPILQIVGVVVGAISVLAGILVFILYKSAVREIGRRQRAEVKLRDSEERYRVIYHKTPVMLHSIDTEGRIIHISDHWVEMMGYSRAETIGRQLTDFFTPQSKKFALNVIFPRFFATGFCKDIPYTYIKKDGKQMDVLLSCYGVRNAKGEVIRSLAVSVDVTDKNKAQRALQLAKEKLALHSHDLEATVRKRTAQLEKAQDNLRNLSKNIIASQEREKEQVARELHDHLGQVLTALRMDAVWLEQNREGLEQVARDRANRMSRLIDDTIKDVRNMAHRLRPRVLDDLGLTDALEAMVSDVENRSHVSCIFRHDPLPPVDDTLATALYRICQEALTNAQRHADATTILVELRTDHSGLCLTITDDGKGFDTDTLKDQDGFGLEGMRERVHLLGGKFTLTSVPGQGTHISCKVKGYP